MLDNDFNLESLGSFDCKNEVFHPVCVIESGFQCLYITKEILPELYSSGPKRQSPKNLVNGADAAPDILLRRSLGNWEKKQIPLWGSITCLSRSMSFRG